MIEANDTAGQVLKTYYEILDDATASLDEERLRAILAPDLDFEGPIAGQVVGAEWFIKGVCGFVETKQKITMVRQVHAGDAAATLYDAELPGGTVRFAEFFEIDAGKIRSLRLLYDASEYRAKGGR
ncbi:MAG: nuclear transport factor 2 family protein [Mycobacteriales bacterium]